MSDFMIKKGLLLDDQAPAKFVDASGVRFVSLKAPNIVDSGNVYLTLPAYQPVSGRAMVANASGELCWCPILISGSVQSGMIADGAVVSGSVASGQIGLVHLASGTVFSGTFVASGTVQSGSLGNSSVVSGSIASGVIGSVHLADGAVLSGDISSGQIGVNHLASGVVVSYLTSGIITSGLIGNGAVVSGSIASGQIAGPHLASGVINAISGNVAVTSGSLSVNTVFATSGNTGVGTSLTIKAADAVGSGAGGNVLLQAGTQVTTGGDGKLVIRQPGGTPGTNEIYLYTVGTQHTLEGAGASSVEINLKARDRTYKFGDGTTAGSTWGTDFTTNYDMRFGNNSRLRWANGSSTNTLGNAGIDYASQGTLYISNGLTSGGSLAFKASTTALNSDTNNLSLDGSAFQRLNVTSGCTVTGLSFVSGGAHVNGRFIRLVNIGTQNLTLSNQDTNSSGNNRFYTATSGNIVLGPDNWVDCVYDSTTGGWRVYGANYPYVFPIVNGTSGQILTTNANNNLVWANGYSLSSGVITSGYLGNASVVSGSIASGVIGSVHLADGAILSGDISSGQIGLNHLASGVVLSGTFVTSGSVQSGALGNASVVSGSIASGSIGQYHLSSGSIVAAGSNAQLQYNLSGCFAGASIYVGSGGSLTDGTAGGFILNSWFGTVGAFKSTTSKAGLLFQGVNDTTTALMLQQGTGSTMQMHCGTQGSAVYFEMNQNQSFGVKAAGGGGAYVPFYIQGHTSQSANLLEWRTSGTVAYINASGTFYGSLSSGIVQSGNVGNNAVISGNIASGQIGVNHLASGVVNSFFASGFVTSGMIANAAIVSGSIASGNIGQMHLSSGAVNSGQLANNAVVSGNIASGTIGTNHCSSGTLFTLTNPSASRIVTSLASGTNSATANTNLTYDGTTFTANSVTSGSTVVSVTGQAGQLLAVTDSNTGDIYQVGDLGGSPIFSVNSSGAVKIVNSGILLIDTVYSVNGKTNFPAGLSWSSGYINSGGPLISTFGSGVILSGNIGNAAVVSGNIASGQIGANHIASGVLAAGLTSGSVTSGYIGNAAVVSGSIASGQIGANHIASGVLAAGLTSGSVTSGYIGNNAVVSGNIASGSIGQMHLSSGAVNSGQLANNVVVSGSIASGSITTNHASSGTLFTLTNPSSSRVVTSLASGTNSATANTNLTYDGTTFTANSVTSGSTVVNVTGQAGTLFSITDSNTGDIYQIGDISGVPILTVNSNGYVRIVSNSFAGQTANFTAFSIADTSGTAAFIEYFAINTATNAYRAGSISAVWNATADTIAYSETTTDSLGGSTIGLKFTAAITSNNFVLTANITTGTWTVKLGTRVL